MDRAAPQHRLWPCHGGSGNGLFVNPRRRGFGPPSPALAAVTGAALVRRVGNGLQFFPGACDVPEAWLAEVTGCLEQVFPDKLAG